MQRKKVILTIFIGLSLSSCYSYSHNVKKGYKSYLKETSTLLDMHVAEFQNTIKSVDYVYVKGEEIIYYHITYKDGNYPKSNYFYYEDKTIYSLDAATLYQAKYVEVNNNGANGKIGSL